MLFVALVDKTVSKGIKEVMVLKSLWWKGKGLGSWTWDLFNNFARFTLIFNNGSKCKLLSKFRLANRWWQFWGMDIKTSQGLAIQTHPEAFVGRTEIL